jgi:hypothetical protein
MERMDQWRAGRQSNREIPRRRDLPAGLMVSLLFVSLTAICVTFPTVNLAVLLICLSIAGSVGLIWLVLAQDMVKRTTLTMSALFTIAFGGLLLSAFPGSWLISIPLSAGFAFFSYLLFRLFLGNVSDFLWIQSLYDRPGFSHRITQPILFHGMLTIHLLWPLMIRRLQQAGSTELVTRLAAAAIDHPNQQARTQALRALEQLTDGDGIDALCALWAHDRRPELAELLRRKQWRASASPEVATLSALLVNDIDSLRASGPDCIPALVQACQDIDPLLAERARGVLQRLKNIETQEAFCRLLVEQETPSLEAIAITAGYLPRDELERALFLFMTEQWERYASHDFDRRLMHRIYALAAPGFLQWRIRAKVRASGRIDFLPILAGDRAAGLDEGANKTIIETLIAYQDWAGLWVRVFELPFEWSVRVMEALSNSGWMPASNKDKVFFAELDALVANGLIMERAKLRQLFQNLVALNVHMLFEQPFAQAEPKMIPLLNALVARKDLSTRVRLALRYAQVVVYYRFRFAIELGEAPAIPLGEFDIEIE